MPGKDDNKKDVDMDDTAPDKLKALTEIKFKKVRYPIKHIIETYLRHPDSQEQDISDEISLKFLDPSPEEEEKMNNPRKEEQLLSKLLTAR